MEVRLNKWLAGAMGVSRREADDLIAEGRVSVFASNNSDSSVPSALTRARPSSRGAVAAVRLEVGVEPTPLRHPLEHQRSAIIAELGCRITLPVHVYVDGEEIQAPAEHTYLALNKPVGYVSSRRAQGEAPTLYELLPTEYHALKTAGRLDKDSSGLILLTDDGDFTYRMTHPSFAKTKIYEVELDRGLEPLHQQMISDFGLKLTDGVSKMGLERVGEGRKKWKVSLGEGRNRQIRRTFGALGYTVAGLHRVQFGKYLLGGLKSGKWEKIAGV